MAFHPAQTWKERGLQVKALQCKCKSILNNLKLPRDDARALGMINVGSICLTLAEVPFKIFHEVETKEGRPKVMKLLGLRTIVDLEKTLIDFDNNIKCSFVTMVQFALENCIEHVLDAIPGEKACRTFSQSCRHLIQITNLADPDIKYSILMVPARIRNSLHAGGIPGHGSKSVEVDGVQYVFEKGKRIACASWSHLIHSFSHGLDIYEEMLCSPIVKSISQIPI